MGGSGVTGSTCSSCGASLAGSPRFCPECGAKLSTPEAQAEIRKTVTLLFTDVTGSTAMGEQLDPEAYRAVLGRYFEVAREAVERHGGTVEKFVGDAVLAVFGVPEVREDDALRAVRAAFELVSGVERLSAELQDSHGVSLVIRTGVNTGSVVAGSSRAGGSFATGDAVNTAARLEQAAGPGEILIGTETYALVQDAVDVEPVAPVVAKGKAEPVPAYRLLAVLEVDRGRTRHFGTELVGRERETRTLDDALDRTVELSRSHLVTVVGPPGIGKSRLVMDFTARAGDRAEVLSGRCVSYGQGITYWPVVQLLRQALALAGTESEELTRHALAELMATAADGTEVVDLVVPLLGGAGPPAGTDATFWAVRRVLEQLASRRPLVVCLDDLQWAEPTLLDLLSQVRDGVQDLPLLMVCQTRPELLDEHPEWGRGSLNSLTFGLEPWSLEQTGQSLAALLDADVPDAVVAAVAGWAGGNPLFVEEIAAHLVDIGVLRRVGDHWELTGDLASARVPPSVSALLSARLDRLPKDERRLLERVSVVGLEFTAGDARAVFAGDGPRAHGLLSALARRDLLRRTHGAAGETWSFRHSMVRDAAYDALPKTVRAELHEQLAAHLADAPEEVASEQLAFVAHHLDSAARYRRELAPGAPETIALVTRAAVALGEAVDLAGSRQDLDAAGTLLQRALDLPVIDASVARANEVRHVQLLVGQGRIAEAPAALDRLEALLDETATDLDTAYVRSMRLMVRQQSGDDVDPALTQSAAEELVRLAEQAGDHARREDGIRATFLSLLVRAHWTEAGRAASLLRARDPSRPSMVGQLAIGGIILQGPEPASALVEWAEQALAERAAWLPRPIAARLTLEAAVGRALGAPDQLPVARAIYDEIVVTDGGDHMAGMLLAQAAVMAGDLEDGLVRLQTMVDRERELGELSFVSTYLSWMACLLLERGEPTEEASAMLEEAAAYTSPHDVASMTNLAVGRALLAGRAGDDDAARNHVAHALEVIDSSDQTWLRADVRRFAAGLAGRRGEAGERRRLLEEAQALYRTKGLTFWVDALERDLAGD